MVYETGTASDIADLFDKLDTFLTSTASGWTDRGLTTGGTKGFARTGAPDQIEVQFRWDTGSPTAAAVYQSLDFDAVGTAPGNHTDDSGQGEISGSNATIITGRHCELVDSTMRYWFFEGGGASRDYCHVVVERVAGPPAQLVSFGFGNLLKIGSWTGGAYSYGFKRSGISSTPAMVDGSISLDGLTAGAGMTPFFATLHAEGLQNLTASEKWLVVCGDANASNWGTDRAGEDRHFCQGGFRGGLTARFFARTSVQSISGLIPMYPIPLYYLDRDPSIDEIFSLGIMPDVRGVNIEHFLPGQELTVGSDTWVVFPSWRDNSGSNDTRDQGIAYRKETS